MRIEILAERKRVKQWWSFIECVFHALFDPQLERNYRWVAWVWIAGLVLFGVYFWGKFLNWGRIPFDFHDWAEINAARIEFVRNALRTGQLPLHMNEIAHLKMMTDRYFSIPDTILAPQMILLLFFPTGQFIYINTLIMFVVGTFGLLQFRKRFSLSLIAFTWLFLLFNFNGHLTAHFSVGHVTWWGYFLIPWFFLLLLDAIEKEPGWRWIAGMAFLLFLIFLQGGFHFYTWLLLFLGLFGLTSRKRFWLAIKTGTATILLSMVRILPVVLLLKEFDTEFRGGYDSIQDIINAMVNMKLVSESIPPRGVYGPIPLGWWEFDLYIGLVATIFLLYFGVFRWLKSWEEFPSLQVLFLPTIALLVMSVSDIYRVVRMVPIPLISGERVSSRMIIIPFIIVLLMAVLYFQRALLSKRLPQAFHLVIIVLMGVTITDLWRHMRAWRVTTAVQAFPVTPVDLAIKVVGNHPDAPYFWMIGIGALITLITAVGLLYLARAERSQVHLAVPG